MAITVKVKYTSIFREITRRGEELILLEKPEVRELVEYLTQAYGKKFQQLLIDQKTGDISLTDGVFVSRGGYRVKMADTLGQGDEIVFLVAIFE